MDLGMAYDFDQLTSVPNAGKYKSRNLEIRRFLRKNAGKVSTKRRTRLRGELKDNRKKANPIDPMTGLPVRDLDAIARQETRTKYGEVTDDLSNDIRGEERRAMDAPAYFDQWRSHLQSLATAQTAAANTQTAALLNDAGAIQQQDTAKQNQVATQAAGNPFAAQSVQAMADASAGRTQMAKNTAAGIGERGAIRSGELQGLGAISHGTQARRVGEIQQGVQKLRSEERRLKKDIGDYFQGSRRQYQSDVLDSKVKSAAASLAGEKFEWDKGVDQARLSDVLSDNARSDALAENTINDTAADNARQQAEAEAKKIPPKHRTTQAQRTQLKKDGIRAMGKIRGNIRTNAKKKRVYDVMNQEGEVVEKIVLSPKVESKLQAHFEAEVGNREIAAALAQQAIYGKVYDGTWQAVRAQGVDPKKLGLSYGGKVKRKVRVKRERDAQGNANARVEYR